MPTNPLSPSSPLSFLEDAARGYAKHPSPESRERLKIACGEAQKAFIDVCVELGRTRDELNRVSAMVGRYQEGIAKLASIVEGK